MYVEEEKEEKAASAATEVKASTTLAAALKSEVKTSPYPICWFEDEETQTALRWHFFTGVLFDLRPSPRDIPWKIRLHFTSYPSNQLLSLADGDVHTHVRSVYKNSLKQAMSLHYGNAKPALNMTKENHGKIWDAIRTANYTLYKQAHSGLPKQSSLRVPVRVLVDGGPPVQKPCLATDQLTLGDVLRVSAPEHFNDEGASASVVDWRMAGLSKAELSTPILHYWVNLAHPDHFLYIIVLTR
jgi:autophagy-related protein 5